MIIKNTGTKIVLIGTTVLMPEATMTADKAVCESSVIKAFVKKGLLTVIAEKATKPSKKSNDGKAADDVKAGEGEE